MLLPNIRTALRILRGHRLRSGLTTLGIVIGVAAVVSMNAIGNGARERVAAQIRSLGTNLIMVMPGSALMSSVRLGKVEPHPDPKAKLPTVEDLQSPRLNENDAQAIGLEIPGVLVVAPVLFTRTQFTVGATSWMGNLHGVTPAYFDAREWEVTDGREMTAEDNRRAAKVMLIGTTMAGKLFGENNPVGAMVRVRDVPFNVIGLLERKGQSVWGEDQDDVAMVPLTTARRQFLGISPASPRLVHNVTVKFAEGTSAEQTMIAIKDLLRQRHRLQPGQEETFLVSNLAEAANIEQTATQTLSVLLAAVAAVSLAVGGIGIMNIMLVTVAERTREIGLRLALGARRRDMLFQFLTEATTLAMFGGVTGAAVGIAFSMLIGKLAGWPIVIHLPSVLIAMIFAGAVGCFFGYYPARKAARMDPIDALRYE